MKTFTILASLLMGSASSATPTTTTTATSSLPTTFSARALASSTKIAGRTINASVTGFWIGNATSSICLIAPPNQSQCPPGNVTIFYNDDNTLYMSAEVPGGQYVYIGPWGALRFTEGHEESRPLPAGSITKGFAESLAGTTPVLKAPEGAKWQACPVDGQPDIYSVFTNTGKFNLQGCIEFEMVISNATGPGAFQYT